MSIYKVLSLNEQDYAIGNYFEIIEMVMYSAVAFLVPFILGHNQLITGVIVNTALVLAALNIRNEKLLPILTLPSIAVFLRGIIFGPFTMYLIYLLPFIWIGNFILVCTIKKINLNQKSNRWLTLGIGSLTKAAFIFLSALGLYALTLIPPQLLLPMGILQLVTALAGGIIAFGLHDLKKNLSL